MSRIDFKILQIPSFKSHSPDAAHLHAGVLEASLTLMDHFEVLESESTFYTGIKQKFQLKVSNDAMSDSE